MSDDQPPRPSLFLARHDSAHREHNHQHQHQHQHHIFHRGTSGNSVIQSIVTEVVATVSVVQQVEVDTNGNTFAIQTVLVNATGDSSTTLGITEISSPATATAASPGITTPESAAASTVPGVVPPPDYAASQSLNISSGTATSSTSTPSIPTSFASLLASSNSTTLISSASSLTPSFSNSSTSTLLSSSSLTYLTASSSSSNSPTTSSTSSLYSPSSSSLATSSASPTEGSGSGATGVSAGTGSSSTAAAGSGNGSNSSSVSTPTVVGGVIGGVAAAAILIFVILFILRWKRRNQSMLSLGSGNEDPASTDTARGAAGGPIQPSGGMTERRSLAFAVPAALASLTGYKRSSQKTEGTMSSTAGSERGFYRVSGRKLPSVLQTGGDGYGGGFGESNTLSGTSFYRDSEGFYGGTGNSPLTPVGMSMQRDSGVPVMRPSPARTPVTEHGPFSAIPAPLTPPRRPDHLGRSHPSQDGSHTSRFTEEV